MCCCVAVSPFHLGRILQLGSTDLAVASLSPLHIFSVGRQSASPLDIIRHASRITFILGSWRHRQRNLSLYRRISRIRCWRLTITISTRFLADNRRIQHLRCGTVLCSDGIVIPLQRRIGDSLSTLDTDHKTLRQRNALGGTRVKSYLPTSRITLSSCRILEHLSAPRALILAIDQLDAKKRPQSRIASSTTEDIKITALHGQSWTRNNFQ